MHRKVAAAAIALLTAIQVLPAAARETRPAKLVRHGARLSLAAQTKLPPVAEAPNDALTKALANGRISEAQYALQRARSLTARRSVSARFGRVASADPRRATIYLRDLALRADDLEGADQIQAKALLARPTSRQSDPSYFGYNAAVINRNVCGTNLCFHWVEGSTDAPPATDADSDGVPDQVEKTQQVFELVYTTEVATMGYRAPLSDQVGPESPTTQLDVYLSDLGKDGIYGFCTPAEQPTAKGVPAFCGVDNDFSSSQFPSTFGDPALEVTAAHEFFHAIQFGYDVTEDEWLLEGTAVWMEDELYDDINDNFQYLPTGALAHPEFPLDFASQQAGTSYGSWIWWRFLSEYFGTATTPNPAIIREVWTRADGFGAGAVDDYSLKAVSNVIKAHGSKLKQTYADFGAINFFPEAFYEEGSDYIDFLGGRIPAPSRRLTSAKPVVKGTFQLDHLSNQYAVLMPGSGIKPSAKLKIIFKLPAAKRGSMASVVALSSTGNLNVVRAQLNADGDDTLKQPFGSGKIEALIIVLTNASSRFSACGSNLPVSCGGLPKDDGLKYLFTGKVVQ